MRLQDKRCFLEAARHFQVWILVRRTNPASLQYVGRPGYTPKRIDCKAKTADADLPPYKLAGLVVDPNLHPGAFEAAKAAKAKQFWSAMLPLPNANYTVDTDSKSKHYGCLKLHGAYIHGDYDLKDIVDMSQPRRNLALVGTMLGQPCYRGPKFYSVKEFINSRIGSPMIQHPGEAQYADHSAEAIDAFGPDGEDVIILNKFCVQAWYDERFEGRKTLG